MRATSLFMLLAPVVAIRYRVSDLTCDRSLMTSQAFPEMKEKFKMQAKTPDMRWKMKKALASLTDADLANCGSCDGIDSAEKRAKVANMPVQHKLKKIFYINPSFAKGRAEWMQKMLSESAPGYDVERFEAATKADANKANIQEFTKKGVQQYVKNLRMHYAPTIAVYLSHARLLKQIHESDPDGEDVYAIFEDDTQAKQGWVTKALTLLDNHVPEDWDIFKIGYWQNGGASHKVTACTWESRGAQYGNLAYLVRPKSIPKILDQLASQEVYDVDGAMHGGNKQMMTVNRTTGKEEYSTKGLVHYYSRPPLVHHGGNFKSLRVFKDHAEEAAIGEDDQVSQVSDNHEAMEKAWPAIEQQWAEAVEARRKSLGLHAKVVGEV